MEPDRLQAARVENAGPLEAVEDYFARGWTDGLPIIPPEPRRVAEFLDAAGLDPAEELGSVPTRDVVVKAEDAAINAVMAGCLPEYMPLVVEIVRAHLTEGYNAHAVTGTLSGAADVSIVNGPIRRAIGINCGDGLFGPGFRANATIGRALRLLVRNVYHSIPGVLDRASYSQPARYTCCIGEDEEGTSWTPLHVQRGLAESESAVTLFANMDTLKITSHRERLWEEMIEKFAFGVRVSFYYQNPSIYADRRCMTVVMGGYHRNIFEKAGMSKDDFQSELFKRIRRPNDGREHQVALARPEKILVVAAGGASLPQSWFLIPFPSSEPQTRAVAAGD